MNWQRRGRFLHAAERIEITLVVERAVFIVLPWFHVGIGLRRSCAWSLDANSSSGGVEVPHTKGLDASFGRGCAHACDLPTRFSARSAKPDIGHFFPNTDPRWKNVPSKVFLEEAAKQVAKCKGKIVNVDATLIAQAPKLYPHIAK